MADNHNKSVLFLSSDDWSESLKTSKYHMTLQLANDGFKVLYVNSIGLRTPKVSSGLWSKILGRLKKLGEGTVEVHPNVRVITPFIIPLHRYGLVNRLNKWLLKHKIRRELKRWDIKYPELWAYLPNHNQLVGQFDESIALYYCVDEHTLFEDVDTVAIRRLEQDLINRSDLLIATAKTLYADKGQGVPEAKKLYLPHGVDVNHFAQALDAGKTTIPEDIAGIDKPMVGFFGLIEEWIDLPAIAEAAKALPDYEFVMIGRVAVDITAYNDVANLRFLGPKPFAELPSYCRQFSCGLMPFRLTEMTANVNPIKMREYLSAGLPVVSSAIPEVIGYSDYCTIYHSQEAFIQQIREAVESTPDRTTVSATMQGENWAGRYEKLREVIDTIKRNKVHATTSDSMTQTT